MSHVDRAEPELSVIVPSVNGTEDLTRCLIALEGEREAVRLEVLVADRCGEEVRSRVEDRFPWARLLVAPPETSIPDLRAMAFEAARAPHIAVIEDHVLVPPGWARAMLEARQSEPGDVVIGGSVENGARERWVDRAAFLCEYSHLLPPVEAGTVEWLTGNNTLYDRETVLRNRGSLGGDRWENELHEALRNSGVGLVSRPEIRVVHRKHYSVGEYIHQRFLYARAFAGARLRERRWPTRLAYGFGALGLPPLLLLRILRASRGKDAVGSAETFRCLPLLMVFVCAWGLGEVAGAWFGGGDAISRVS